MTNRDAIELIEHHREILKNTFDDDYYIIKALEIATNALEKAIPKKPISDWDCGCSVVRCPSCNSLLYCSDWTIEIKRRYHQQYCLDCGQRLTKPMNYCSEWEDE